MQTKGIFANQGIGKPHLICFRPVIQLAMGGGSAQSLIPPGWFLVALLTQIWMNLFPHSSSWIWRSSFPRLLWTLKAKVKGYKEPDLHYQHLWLLVAQDVHNLLKIFLHYDRLMWHSLKFAIPLVFRQDAIQCVVGTCKLNIFDYVPLVLTVTWRFCAALRQSMLLRWYTATWQ